MIEHNQELHRTSWTSIVFKGRKRKKQEQTKQSAEDNFNKCPSVFWQDCQKRPERKVWEVKTNILIMKKKKKNNQQAYWWKYKKSEGVNTEPHDWYTGLP